MTSDTAGVAPRLWWCIKVGAGAALIALLCAHYLMGMPQVTLDIPRWLAQALVLTGGIKTLLHHRIVAGACAGNQPARLVDSGGLYGWVRHPMYLGDCLLYAGMGLLVPHLQLLQLQCCSRGDRNHLSSPQNNITVEKIR